MAEGGKQIADNVYPHLSSLDLCRQSFIKLEITLEMKDLLNSQISFPAFVY
jgi:hypothetical protein